MAQKPIKESLLILNNIENLKNQSFFHPYPDGLIQVTDSGKSIH